jgi:hypothetical protein
MSYSSSLPMKVEELGIVDLLGLPIFLISPSRIQQDCPDLEDLPLDISKLFFEQSIPAPNGVIPSKRVFKRTAGRDY